MDDNACNRRDFLKLAGLGGLVFASGLPGCAGYGQPESGDRDFFFVQLTGTHWGFQGPAVESGAAGHVQKGVASVNEPAGAPDLVVVTGGLPDTAEDPKERRRGLCEFREIVGALKVRNVRFMPGEHDASL